MELRELILKDRPGTTVVLLSGDTSLRAIPDDVPLLEKPFTAGSSVNEYGNSSGSSKASF
jgi:hypothetical protein